MEIGRVMNIIYYIYNLIKYIYCIRIYFKRNGLQPIYHSDHNITKRWDSTPIVIPPTRESVTASDHFPRGGIHAPTGTSSHAKNLSTSEHSLREGPYSYWNTKEKDTREGPTHQLNYTWEEHLHAHSLSYISQRPTAYATHWIHWTH